MAADLSGLRRGHRVRTPDVSRLTALLGQGQGSRGPCHISAISAVQLTSQAAAIAEGGREVNCVGIGRGVSSPASVIQANSRTAPDLATAIRKQHGRCSWRLSAPTLGRGLSQRCLALNRKSASGALPAGAVRYGTGSADYDSPTLNLLYRHRRRRSRAAGGPPGWWSPTQT
jgi:hypothetical protein